MCVLLLLLTTKIWNHFLEHLVTQRTGTLFKWKLQNSRQRKLMVGFLKGQCWGHCCLPYTLIIYITCPKHEKLFYLQIIQLYFAAGITWNNSWTPLTPLFSTSPRCEKWTHSLFFSLFLFFPCVFSPVLDVFAFDKIKNIKSVRTW